MLDRFNFSSMWVIFNYYSFQQISFVPTIFMDNFIDLDENIIFNFNLFDFIINWIIILSLDVTKFCNRRQNKKIFWLIEVFRCFEWIQKISFIHERCDVNVKWYIEHDCLEDIYWNTYSWIIFYCVLMAVLYVYS